jgi:transposase
VDFGDAGPNHRDIRGGLQRNKQEQCQSAGRRSQPHVAALLDRLHCSPPNERIHASRGGRRNLKGITVSQHHEPPPELALTTTNPTTANPAGTILAIDLGNYKSVCCLYAGSPDNPRFDSCPTDRAPLGRLLERHRPSVVVIEACLLAGWVHDLCAARGLVCLVANTASEAWQFKLLKRKTDKDDALRLAQLYALGLLPTVALPPPATRPWRALIAYRQTLVGRRVAVQNRMRALFVAQGLPAPRGAKAWTALGLDGLTLQGKPRAACGPGELWRGLLGLALAEYRQLVELLGHTEHRGPALLRKLLVECAWVMLRYHGWARAVYLRLTHGGKARKKQAIVALARKLLVRCWAMLRDRTLRRDPTRAAASAAAS